MLRTIASAAVLITATTIFSQTINVSGNIKDINGNAISGAIVHLKTADLSDTTGSDGNYQINFIPTSLIPHPISHGKIKMESGILEAQLEKQAKIKLDILDVNGNLVGSEHNNNATPGYHRWDLDRNFSGQQLLIVLLSIDNQVFSFRYLPLGTLGKLNTSNNNHQNNKALSKSSLAPDTLEISADGYFSRSISLASQEMEQDAIMYKDNGKTPPGPSEGCGQGLGDLTSDYRSINSNSDDRDYYLDIPENYNPNYPHRLFFAMHWGGGNYTQMVDGIVEWGQGTGPEYAFYGLKHRSQLAEEPSIFIAPNGIDGRWTEAAHPLFDNLLAFAKKNLCIDTTRVFSTGFSFGGMITYSLSTNHQKDLRAVVGLAPANYVIYLPEKVEEPIAYMSATGMDDTTCPWDAGDNERGAKFALLEKATDNGCDIPNDIPTTFSGSRTHMCYEFEGCMEGYPVVGCTFDGGHIANVGDGGTGNVGGDSWIVKESWDFFAQF